MLTPEEIGAYIIGGLGLLLTILNIRDRLKAIKKEEDQPVEDLKNRVDDLEDKVEQIEKELTRNGEKFEDQEETNATFRSVMLSFVNFEIAYCLYTDYKHTDELMKAKDELEKYLAGKKRNKKP